MKKLFTAAACALGLALATVAPSKAEWAPPGPIKLIIAFAAGGGADTQARLIAEDLEARHGWTIIPEQVTGKGGLVAAAALAKEPADGTTIAILVTESLGYNMVAANNPGFGLEDFTPIATTAGFQMGIVSKADKGWTTFEDVIAAAKNGETIRFGVMSPKLADLAYLLGKANDVEFNIISVRGGKAVMDGVVADDMDLGFMAGIQAKGVASGDLVNLASGLSTELVQTPDAPLLKDLGVNYDADGFFFFVAPAGIPDEARTTLADAIGAIVSDPSTKAGALVEKAFGGATVLKGDELDAFMQSQVDSASDLLKAASE